MAGASRDACTTSCCNSCARVAPCRCPWSPATPRWHRPRTPGQRVRTTLPSTRPPPTCGSVERPDSQASCSARRLPHSWDPAPSRGATTNPTAPTTSAATFAPTTVRPRRARPPSHRLTYPALLNLGRRLGAGVKPYRCQEPGCGYASSDSGALRRHQRIHTGDKPAKCDWRGCGFSYVTRHTLLSARCLEPRPPPDIMMRMDGGVQVRRLLQPGAAQAHAHRRAPLRLPPVRLHCRATRHRARPQ